MSQSRNLLLPNQCAIHNGAVNLALPRTINSSNPKDDRWQWTHQSNDGLYWAIMTEVLKSYTRWIESHVLEDMGVSLIMSLNPNKS